MGNYKEKNKRKKTRRLEAFHNFWKKHWFWYTIIIALPSAWFSVILPYFGKWFQLLNENSDITKVGTVITFILIVVVASLSFLNNWYLSKTEDSNIAKMEGEIQYLSTIMDNVDKICEEKYSGLKTKVMEIKTAQTETTTIISNPSNQLKRIINGITECLVNLLNNKDTKFRFRDFLVTLAYNFPQEDETWRWTEGTVEKEMGLDVLLAPDCPSTFNHLLRSNKPYYFNNKKEDAEKVGLYAYTPQDELNLETEDGVGSIFCYRYQVKKSGKVYVDAMLSITTQKKRFSKDEVESCNNVRENMISLVRDTFGKRIGIELSLLYLEYLRSKELSEKIVSKEQIEM